MACLQERQQPFRSIYVPQATATSFGLGGIFVGGFPDSSQGAALLNTARTVPGHCLNTQFVSTSCAVKPMMCRRATAGFQSVLDQWQSRHMDTSFKRREGWSGLSFLQPIEVSRNVSCGIHTNLAFQRGILCDSLITRLSSHISRASALSESHAAHRYGYDHIAP
jgi:hypothetical protein